MKLNLKSGIGEIMESFHNEEKEEDLIKEVLKEARIKIDDKKDEIIDFDGEK